MIKECINLQEAVCKVFGSNFKKLCHPSKQWSSFTTYQTTGTDLKFLIKFIEVPITAHISQEIYRKKLQTMKTVLHEVKFFFVERCFQCSYYLLLATEDVVSVRSMIRLARESNARVEPDVIYRFLEFVAGIQKMKLDGDVCFDLQQIGVTSQNSFVIANYSLYFQGTPRNPTFQADIKRVLYSMITLDQNLINISPMEIYSLCHQKYSQEHKLCEIILKYMNSQINQTNSKEVLTLISTYNDSNSDAGVDVTLTDSLVDAEKIDCEDILGVYSSMTVNDCTNDSLSIVKKYRNAKQKQKQKKLIIFMIIFVILLVGAGAMTYQYLGHNNNTCGEAEFYNSSVSRCQSCSLGCERCESGQQSKCFSCKGDMFLVIQHQNDLLGSCQLGCKGRILKTRQCLCPPSPQTTLQTHLTSIQ